jgi:hypothetical protein
VTEVAIKVPLLNHPLAGVGESRSEVIVKKY